jgi:DNA-binding transcriptional LysR family regulator
MDAHLLRTFVAVARLGSFSAAAAELAYTQAAVSQQIAALEADLKVTLLRRRPVEPTEAGTRLLEHAVPILLRIDAARADVSRMTAPPAARLIVAMTPLATSIPASADDGVAGALARLRAALPRLELTVRVASRQAVAEATARGEADLGLIDGLAAPSDPLPLPVPLPAIGVGECAVSVILPAAHPLASPPASPIGLRSLADARWIDAPAVGPALADLRRVTGTEGFRAACRYEGTDVLTVLRLAAAGHGLTLLPSALWPAFPLAPVAVVEVSAPRLVHRVELVHGTLPAGSPAAALAALLCENAGGAAEIRRAPGPLGRS